MCHPHCWRVRAYAEVTAKCNCSRTWNGVPPESMKMQPRILRCAQDDKPKAVEPAIFRAGPSLRRAPFRMTSHEVGISGGSPPSRKLPQDVPQGLKAQIIFGANSASFDSAQDRLEVVPCHKTRLGSSFPRPVKPCPYTRLRPFWQIGHVESGCPEGE